jgi:hypothetical protein
MINRTMAIDASQIVRTHVYIDARARIRKSCVQISVLNRVSTTSTEMATTAVIAARTGNALGRQDQIHARRRISTGLLDILS